MSEMNDYWMRFQFTLRYPVDLSGDARLVGLTGYAHLVAETHKQALKKLTEKLEVQCLDRWNISEFSLGLMVILDSRPVIGFILESICLDKESFQFVNDKLGVVTRYGLGPEWTYVNNKDLELIRDVG